MVKCNLWTFGMFCLCVCMCLELFEVDHSRFRWLLYVSAGFNTKIFYVLFSQSIYAFV